jgi:hypothetical protein
MIRLHFKPESLVFLELSQESVDYPRATGTRPFAVGMVAVVVTASPGVDEVVAVVPEHDILKTEVMADESEPGGDA